MDSFYLAPVEGGYEVPMKEGKISVGRGPFLRIIDRRVSRRHAMIEVSGSTMRVLPIHTNPTFFKGSGATKFEALEKDKPRELQHGDCIAFLPDNLVFKVLCKAKSSSVIAKDEETPKSSHVIDSEEVEMKNEELHGGNICEEFKKESVVAPLKKTRNLPSWMVNSEDKTPSKTAKKDACSQKKSKQDDTFIIETSEMVTSVDEKKEENDKENCDDKVEKDIDKLTENSDVEEEEQNVPETTITEEEHKKRKREESEETGSSEQAAKREKPLPCCPYGNQCYRKNPVHFQEYSHGEQSVQSQSENSSSEDERELPECPYGMDCYRSNPEHQKEYKHTAILPKTRDRKAKTKAGVTDDTTGNSDYDDSFIDDESEGSYCEPSENDDSDWQPDDEEECGDEDVGQLIAEARGFTKNEKMLKPS